jgi:hypothetical protein
MSNSELAYAPELAIHVGTIEITDTGRFAGGTLYSTIPHAEVWSNNATSTTVNATTYTEIDATGATLSQSSGGLFDMPVPGRIRWLGTGRGDFSVSVTCSFGSSVNNLAYTVAAGINGVLTPSSLIQRKIAAGADIGAVSFHAILQMEPNSYFSVLAIVDSGTPSLLMKHYNISAIRLGGVH